MVSFSKILILVLLAGVSFTYSDEGGDSRRRYFGGRSNRRYNGKRDMNGEGNNGPRSNERMDDTGENGRDVEPSDPQRRFDFREINLLTGDEYIIEINDEIVEELENLDNSGTEFTSEGRSPSDVLRRLQIQGNDDRVEITGAPPYGRLTEYTGLLLFDKPGQGTFMCTATLMASWTHIVTAAHCVHGGPGGSYYTNFRWSPRRTGNWNQGEIQVTTAWALNEWISYGNYNWDFAVLKLQTNPGLGWAGYSTQSLSSSNFIHISGYPGDKTFGTMWQTNSYILNAQPNYFTMGTSDIWGGMSGSNCNAVNSLYIVGILYGYFTSNDDTICSRLTNSKLSWILDIVNGNLPPTGCVHIRSRAWNKYVNSGGNSLYQPLEAKVDWRSTWERFEMTYDSGSGNYYIRSITWDRYWQARPDGSLNAGRNGVSLGAWERFDVVSCGTDCFSLRSEAFNKYVVAESNSVHTLYANRNAVGSWEQFDITSCVW